MHFKHKDICGIAVRKLQLCRIFQNAGADLRRKHALTALAKGGTKEGEETSVQRMFAWEINAVRKTGHL